MVTSNDSRSYYMIRKVNGRARRIRLADGAMALENVRKLAIQTAADVVKGVDPIQERRARRAKVATLAELWQVYGDEKPRTPRTVVADGSLWKLLGPTWHAHRLDSITPEMVAGLHSRIGKERGHVSANRSVQLIRRVYRFAKRRRLYRGDNPAEGIDFYPERSRERFISPSELPAILKAIDAEPQPWPDYFRLLLLTGARRSALASMRWSDVDLSSGTWTIPAEHSKNGVSITVPLVEEAVKRLKRRKSEALPGAVYVFPASGAAGHIINPWEAWDRIRTAAKIPDITMHDLRRTCGSYLAAAGVPLPVIGKALGHRSQQSTAIYARLDVTAVREELRHVADAMNRAGKTNGRKPKGAS